MESVTAAGWAIGVVLAALASIALVRHYWRKWLGLVRASAGFQPTSVQLLRMREAFRHMGETSEVLASGLRLSVAKLRGDRALVRKLERDRRDAIGQQIADTRLVAARELFDALDGAAWMAGRLTTVTVSTFADWPARATGEAEEALALIQEARVHAERLAELAKEVALRPDGPAPITFPAPDESLSVMPSRISGGGQA